MSAWRLPRTAVLVGLALAAVAGCSEAAPTTPQLRDVSPAAGPDDAPTAVTLSGEAFAPRVVTDFSRKGASRVDDDWGVRGGDTEWRAVRRVDASTLVASVPAGLPAGWYDVTVTDPYGRTAALARAYRVVRVGEPAALVFPGPALTLPAGACSAAVAVETRDGLGGPALNVAATSVALSASPGGTTFFADAACTTAVNGLTLSANTFGSTFHFRAAAAGTVTLTAGAAGLSPAVQQHTVTLADGGAGGGGGGEDGGDDGGSAADAGCFAGGAPRCDAGTSRVCDSFEASTFAPHWMLFQANGNVGLTSACAYRGSSSVAVALPARGPGGVVEAQLATDNGAVPSAPATWYARAYYYVPAPLPPYPLGLLKVQQGVSPYHGVHLRIGAGGTLDVLNDRDTPNVTTSALTFPLNRWVCVELEVGIGGPAPIRARIDGTQVMNFSQTTTASPTFTRFVAGQIPTVAAASASAWTYYVDDLVISTSPIGCAN